MSGVRTNTCYYLHLLRLLIGMCLKCKAHTHTYTHMHVCTDIYTCAQTHTCTHKYTHTYAHEHTYVYSTHIHLRVHTHLNTHTNVYRHTPTHTYTHAPTNTHTYIYTYANTPRRVRSHITYTLTLIHTNLRMPTHPWSTHTWVRCVALSRLYQDTVLQRIITLLLYDCMA